MDFKDEIIAKLTQQNALLTENLNRALSKITSLQKTIVSLQTMIVSLQTKINELEKKSKKNSTNSDKPPSSDGLAKKPKPTSLRKKGKKKSGGQLGHKGHTLTKSSNPDRVIEHLVNSCQSCFVDLTQTKPDKIIDRQVVDLPIIKFEITEHRAEIKICSCGHRNEGMFPDHVKTAVQYGPNVQAFATYFLNQQLIPEDRLADMFQDVFNLPIATATLIKANQSFFDKTQNLMTNVKDNLLKSKVKNLDESGLRVTGKNHWIHVLCNNRATVYRIDEKRGAMFEGLKGTIIHDHFKSYFTLENVTHGLCNAHILRELKSLIEHEKEPWARKMFSLLLYSNKHRENPKRISKLYDQAISLGFDYHESMPPLPKKGKRGKQPHRDGHNLVIRMKNHKEDVLRFLKDENVPFTNNQAEQDIRMVKVKMKISGGFRSKKGADVFCGIRGFISTCRKQGLNIFQAISDAILGIMPEFSF